MEHRVSVKVIEMRMQVFELLLSTDTVVIILLNLTDNVLVLSPYFLYLKVLIELLKLQGDKQKQMVREIFLKR